MIQNPTPQQLKKSLVEAGFVVFRTLPEEVVLAERVRENLIMDSGIRLRVAPLGVRVVFRIRRGSFPGEDDAKLFERARTLGAAALTRGFREVSHQSNTVTDPGDSTRKLDTFYEVVFERDAATLEAALDDIRFAFGQSRMAHD
jgi:hypothetical protein